MNLSGTLDLDHLDHGPIIRNNNLDAWHYACHVMETGFSIRLGARVAGLIEVTVIVARVPYALTGEHLVQERLTSLRSLFARPSILLRTHQCTFCPWRIRLAHDDYHLYLLTASAMASLIGNAVFELLSELTIQSLIP